MGRIVKHWLTCALLAACLLAPVPARADFLEDAGMGTVTVLANIGYIPAKLVYAILGGVTGGFAYVLTGANYTVAEKVWTPSLGGHYVINTAQVRGTEPIYFSGTVTP